MTDVIISEKFSETQKKPGRPRNELWYNTNYQQCMNDLSPKKGMRSIQNRSYCMDAVRILCNGDYDLIPRPYPWLLGTGDYWIGMKSTILTELGRLYDLTNDAEDLKQLAEWICEKKPKTQEIIKILREIRLDYRRQRS